MENLDRALRPIIENAIGENKVILITGTRRVGKTVLLKAIKEEYKGPSLYINGEDFDMQALLRHRSAANYKSVIGDATLLMIDEEQAIPDIGPILKLMIDSIAPLTIVATVSSSFDLINKTGDPLTGRKYQMMLYPMAQAEIKKSETRIETLQNLDDRLIYGSYPALFGMKTTARKQAYLQDLVQSYLLKDILAYEGIRHSDKIVKILRLIAHQVGCEVSYSEIGQQLGMSKNTVENYLDLLSKVFIVFKLWAYSTNLRKEISKGVKWYFYDNGIRNAIINDFSFPALRNDMGVLWENYMLSERIKRNAYAGQMVHYYFWRTYDQQEIDLIEAADGKISAYEFKLSPQAKAKRPDFFAKSYPGSTFEKISKDNYLDWIS